MPGPSNALLRMAAQGGQPRMADAMARGYQQGNAMLQAQQDQERHNALAEVAQAYAQGGPQAAAQVAGRLGQFPQAVALGTQGYQRGRDVISDEAARAKAALPTSALGKLTADFRSGHVSPEVYQAKVGAIGKGGVNVYTGNIPLGKKPATDTQTAVINRRIERIGIGNVRENYDPSFLTYPGQAANLAARTVDKFGRGDLIPKERREALAKSKRFQQGVQRAFDRYRKEITGAAAAIQEMEALKLSIFNLDQSPIEFEAALDNYEKVANRVEDLRIELLSRGIDPKTPEGGRELDNLLFAQTQQPVAAPPVQMNGFTIEEIPPNG